MGQVPCHESRSNQVRLVDAGYGEEKVANPNEPMTISISAGALERLVSGAWHDSAIETGSRVVAALKARDEVIREIAGDHLPYVGVWTQIFDEGASKVERQCGVVLDSKAKVIAAVVVRDNKDRDASREEIAQIQDSIDANDVGADMGEWEFAEEDLPTWAADQIHDRAREAEFA